MATLQSGKCFTVPTFFGLCCRSEWQERMYIYKWHEVDQTKHEIFCVHIVCNEIQVKVNLEITTFFFYLRFPYCPNFFWFGVVHLGLLDMEGDLIDWETELEIELSPPLSPSSPLVQSSPPSSLVPLSSPEGLPILQCPLLENARPPTRSCLLHRCRLAAPLLALSPLSVRCEPHGSAILQRRRGWSIPHLRLQGPDSASARRPSGSTVTRLSISSTGLPRPSGSALVGRRPAIASGLRSSGYASSLHPTGSVGLLPPASSTWVLGRSGFGSPPWSPEPSAPPWPPRSSASPWLVGSLLLCLGLLNHLLLRRRLPPVILCLKALVLSVSVVGSWTSIHVFLCLLRSRCTLLDIKVLLFLWIPRLLVPCFHFPE